MSNIFMMDSTCTETLRRLDSYVDNELDTAGSAAIASHLESCTRCYEEVELRRRLRNRLKQAVAAAPAAPYLHTKVTARLHASERHHGWFDLPRQLAAAAAMVAICVGVTAIAYQLGHLRLTARAQESYIGSISSRVASIMRVGLGDHVHCSIFRQYPKEAPPLEQMVADLGPDYKGLVDVIAPHVPQGFRVMQGHRCKYHGRQFVHLSMKSGKNLISVVITRKREGETFRTSKLLPALSQPGLPIYHDGVQRFDITGFETRDHLVYLVSDATAKQSQELMLAVAPGIEKYLAKLES